ncbi:hypothetical protein ACJJTC_019818 [Scirpophaga incertulas]
MSGRNVRGKQIGNINNDYRSNMSQVRKNTSSIIQTERRQYYAQYTKALATPSADHTDFSTDGSSSTIPQEFDMQCFKDLLDGELENNQEEEAVTIDAKNNNEVLKSENTLLGEELKQKLKAVQFDNSVVNNVRVYSEMNNPVSDGELVRNMETTEVTDSTENDTEIKNTFPGEELEQNIDTVEDSVQNENDINFINIEECTTNNPIDSEVDIKKKTRKRLRQPQIWKKNKKKCLKNLGKSYVTYKGKVIQAKKLKAPCAETCRLKCSEKIDGEQRLSIFNNFWKLGELSRQRDFVSKCIKEVKPKYSLHNENSKRSLNLAYHFIVDSETIRVCKRFFQATLDIGHSFITTIKKKTSSTGTILEDMRGKCSKGNSLPDTIKNGVSEHINTYPRKESHYCRSSTSREYLDGDLNLSLMYRQYKEWCVANEKPLAKKGTYEHIFTTEFNISFYRPKKDQCSLCCSYNNMTSEDKLELESTYQTHIQEKEMCRGEKKVDIELCQTDERKVICCFDMQAVLQTPAGNDSLFFYKRRLNVYNCTVYDITKKTAHCYLWDETLGGKGCDEVGTCILQFLKEFCSGKHVLFYTDNCSAQNKNKYLLALYHYAMKVFQVQSITHKYFIVGHTQNEGDSVHSTIEQEKSRILRNGSVFVPSQWRSIIQCAKKKGNPYHVHDIDFTDIIDLKELLKQFGKNFSLNTDGDRVVWNNIKKMYMQHTNPYIVFYLDTYLPNSTMKSFDVRHKMRSPAILEMTLTNKFRTRPPISDLKKKDLISLCQSKVIPRVYWDYYENLPASSELNVEVEHDEEE